MAEDEQAGKDTIVKTIAPKESLDETIAHLIQLVFNPCVTHNSFGHMKPFVHALALVAAMLPSPPAFAFDILRPMDWFAPTSCNTKVPNIRIYEQSDRAD